MPRPDDDTLTAEDLEAVLDVTRALAAPFDLRSLLGAIADAACRVLHAERASVWLLDATRQELVLEVAHDLAPLRLPLGHGLVGACAREGRPLNVPDGCADPRFAAAVDGATGFHTRNSLSLPLVDHRGQLVGVMQVLNHAQGPFGPRAVSRAEALAAQAAVALSRVRLAEAQREAERLHHELELARAVQLATLPHDLPPVDGYDVHAVFRPAEQTGGDAYDVALTPQGVLLVLADAAGHGAAPALSVTQMHAMLRRAVRLGADLETTFRQVNDQLADTLVDGRFVCACIGLLDPATHRLRLLSGGLAPIVHLRAAERCCVRHRATSFPLGAMPLARAPRPQLIELEPGDVLLLMSDGLHEQADARGQAFGVDAVGRVPAAADWMAVMDMRVDEIDNRVRCARLNGRLDAPTADRIGVPFTAAVSVDGRDAVVDVSGVNFVASMGLRLLIACARSVHARGRRLVLFGAQGMVATVLSGSAIDQIIPVVATRDEALSLVAERP